MVSARVIKKRVRALTGCCKENSILDKRQYKVDFPDGSIDTYTANVIAENLGGVVDPIGWRHALFSGIIDHWFNDHGK
jgi:hypothetical protein